MNDISKALGKKRAEKAIRRYEVGAESGADWGLTLIYQALHDKYGFGRNRFAKLNAACKPMIDLPIPGLAPTTYSPPGRQP